MALLEVVGIASILPFMQLAAEPEVLTENEWMSWAYTAFGFSSPRAMLITAGIAVLLLLAVANTFKAFAVWLQNKYAWDVAHNLSLRLLRTYMNRPYTYFLVHNSSEVSSNLLHEVAGFTTGVLLPLTIFASQMIVSLIIFVLLLVIAPTVALTVLGILGGTYGLIYLFRHGFLKRLGEERIDANLERIKNLDELLSGIKTLRVYNAQDFFFRRFEKASFHFSRILPRVQFLSAAPKFIIEIIAFGGILAIALFLLVRAPDLKTALPMLSLYAIAGYRLLPALQNAFSAITRLRHHFPVVDIIHDNLKSDMADSQTGDPERTELSFSQSILLENVTFQYESAPEPVLKDLNVSISKGQTIAFVGVTGSGKTTLVDLIAGLLYPSKGAVFIDDTALTPSTAAVWQRRIAYVPQDIFLFDDTVAQNIAFGVEKAQIDNALLEQAAKMADIFTFITRELPQGFNTPIGENGVRLSGGQKQRLGLARALYRKPEVLILDEATSALDGITENVVIEALKTLTGNLTVWHADDRFLLEEGRIIASGPFVELMSSSDIFRAMAKQP